MASTRPSYPDHLRRIRFKDPESGKTLVFLTNNTSLPALTIAALYKSRWQVELFFKWIKRSGTGPLGCCTALVDGGLLRRMVQVDGALEEAPRVRVVLLGVRGAFYRLVCVHEHAFSFKHTSTEDSFMTLHDVASTQRSMN